MRKGCRLWDHVHGFGSSGAPGAMLLSNTPQAWHKPTSGLFPPELLPELWEENFSCAAGAAASFLQNTLAAARLRQRLYWEVRSVLRDFLFFF